MRVATTSAEYTEWLKKKYMKKRNLLERGTQCTISYGAYDYLLRQRHSLNNHGNDINVFILDTGIASNHREFVRHPEYAFDALSSPPLLDDPNGHGTHVAGLIAGKTVGVAPHSRLIDVRIAAADGSARIDNVLAGLDYIAGLAIRHNNNSTISFGLLSVVCIALTGDFRSSALNGALDAVSSVVMIIGSAGENNKYTCSISPASSLSVIVAAATSRESDLELLGSNYGECIHIFAPGEDLLTSGIESTNSMVNVSGSSASAAIVTAVWASLLRVYSVPENLRLQVDDPKRGFLDDPILSDADRLLLLKDSLLHPLSGYRTESTHEIPWLSCEFSTPESVLRHMNRRFHDWVESRRAMKKFFNPNQRRQFIASQTQA